MAQHAEAAQPIFLRANQIAGPTGRLPIGLSTWWKWVKEGKAPQPIKLGPMTTVWRCSDVDSFLEGLAAPIKEVR